MGLGKLIEKYEGGKVDTKGWYRLGSDCEGCIFDIGDPKYCLVYLEEGGKEKPSSGCKYRKTFKEGVISGE